ncbi:MAG: NAD-dependent epimerase/dehydratase family protein, partial [Anaerolineales bacterium]
DQRGQHERESVPLVVPDPLNPRYSYGGGKIISELLTLNYGREHFERVLIFRPHNVYGPDMGFEHVLPEFALRMHRLHAEQPEGVIPFPIQGSGAETRAFVYIDDFSDGLMLLLEHGAHMGIYNIGTREERTVAEVAAEVARVFGRQIELVPGKLQTGSTPRRCPDISQLEALGYGPQVSFAEGVARTTAWYVNYEETQA